jgi:hypothetical protein
MNFLKSLSEPREKNRTNGPCIYLASYMSSNAVAAWSTELRRILRLYLGSLEKK